MKSRRKYAVLFFLLAFVLVIIMLLGLWLILHVDAHEYFNGFSPDDSNVVYMRVGESVPVLEQDSDALVEMRGDYDADELFLDASGNLHATRAGRYEISLIGSNVYFGDEMVRSKIADYVVIVEDTDFSEYKPVTCFADLEEEGKYILADSFKVEGVYEGSTFQGTLVNPDGYTITLAAGRPLFEEVGESAIISGLRIRFEGDVFSPAEGAFGEFQQVGAIACVNNGAIVGCSVEGTLVSDGNHLLSGIAGTNGSSGIVYAGSFTGEAFGEMIGGGIAGNKMDRGIRACTVRADAYKGTVRDALAKRTLFCGTWDSDVGQQPKKAGADGMAEDGNRVFNLDGTVEVDFTRIVTVRTCINGDDDAGEKDCFVGSIVERGSEFWRKDIRCVRMEDTVRGERNADEPYYAPACEEVGLEFTFYYKETKFIDGPAGIERIEAAQERVELPEGAVVSRDVILGEYSPETVTLVFSEGAVIGRERGDVANENILLDFSQSGIYEEEDGSLYLHKGDDLVLVRYGGEAEDGLVTIPDRATRIGGDPFGGLEFEAIDTGRASGFYVENASFDAAWRRNIRELYLGASFDMNNLAAEGQTFPNLEYVESDARADGYTVTKEGYLIREEGAQRRLVYVPAALVRAGTLEISGFTAIGEGALQWNLAYDIVLTDVACVEAGGITNASVRTLTVNGETAFETGAVSQCFRLASFATGQEAQITLKSGAINECSYLHNIRLSDSFRYVAYDAVENCANFYGYEIDEGCEAFDVRGGLLFEEGKALIPQRWKEEVLTFAENDVTLALYGQQEMTVTILFEDAEVRASLGGNIGETLDVRALYSGSREEYAASGAQIGRPEQSGVKIYYYMETEPVRRGNYWHYGEDGSVQIWSKR